MVRYVALLRGINVGGTNKVPMAALRGVFEAAGHTAVRTYINSGNVVFDAPRTPTAHLANELETILGRALDVSTRVLVLPGATVTKIADALPADWRKDDEWSCDVLYLLPERASPKTMRALDLDPEHEEARYCAGAILFRVNRSYLNRSTLHKLIGTDLYASMTIRNCNTARKLAAIVAES